MSTTSSSNPSNVSDSQKYTSSTGLGSDKWDASRTGLSSLSGTDNRNWNPSLSEKRDTTTTGIGSDSNKWDTTRTTGLPGTTSDSSKWDTSRTGTDSRKWDTSRTGEQQSDEWLEVNKMQVDLARENRGTVALHTKKDSENYNSVLEDLTKLKINENKPTKTLKNTDSEILKECYELPGAQPAWKRKGQMYLEHTQAGLMAAAQGLSAKIQQTTARALHKIGHSLEASTTTPTTDTTSWTATGAPTSYEGGQSQSALKVKGQELLKQGQSTTSQILHKAGEKLAPSDTTTTTTPQTAPMMTTPMTSTSMMGTTTAPTTQATYGSATTGGSMTESTPGQESALKVKAKELAQEGSSTFKTKASEFMAAAQQKGSELFHKAGSKMEPTDTTTTTTGMTTGTPGYTTATPSYTSATGLSSGVAPTGSYGTATTSTGMYDTTGSNLSTGDQSMGKGQGVLREGQRQGADLLHRAANKVDPDTTTTGTGTTTGVAGGRDYRSQ